MLENKFQSSDNKEISYLFFGSKREQAKSSILIIHGMMEVKERYSEFAEFLANNGYNVYIFDIRGHGYFALENKPIAFSNSEGTDEILDDIDIFIREIIKETPVLFGHSLGSVLALKYATEHNNIDKLILSGPPYMSNFDIFFGKIISGIEGLFIKRGKSILNFKFGSYNKHFSSSKTKYDWLSRDDKEIEKYIENNKCGTYATPKFFREFLKNLQFTYKNLSKVNKKAKILLLYGSEDMVTNNGKSIKYLRENLKSIDRDVKLLENKNGRHESLHEINKYEIYDFILEWLNQLYEKKK